MKSKIKKIPILGRLATSLNRQLRKTVDFSTSGEYWEKRYEAGGDSGPGSYSRLAEFKADVINAFVKKNQIKTVLDFGFGDGNQLELLQLPRYQGFEISQSAVLRCRENFKSDPTKSFKHLGEYSGEQGDLVMSLDVLYHLVEQSVFEDHLKKLFGASKRFVAIYASNVDEDDDNPLLPHVKRRKFSTWVGDNRPDFQLKELIPNKYPYDGDAKVSSRAEFYIYERI